MDKRSLLIRAHLCRGIGPKGEQKIFQYMQENNQPPHTRDLVELLGGSKANLEQFLADFHSKKTSSKMAANQRAGGILTILDAEYPAQLKETYEPPLVLFYRGNLALLKQPALAVVGARKMSSYGPKVLQQLLPQVCHFQIPIISGAAMGIDSVAHQTTLQAHGQTIAVIGTGLDLTYPRGNEQLQTQISSQGLLLTEYELGQKPLAFHFPMRNRIIAGLCHSLLVVEAQHHSGSLITANLALQENRNVLAVPGAITSASSIGCNELIQAGAKPVLKSADILEDFLNTLTNED
ncbi:DNA processing protein [Ligilactobacillus salitolerans]|uniref:DNA processing protein n=1 Tax=Ligilactobacillus salitolerans TaxID=1808352 RepID=A0A401ITP8_9LACO|nr:DNA-processing protein DprA [Ligilactobacillus salitolerans]GBG94875.1 DNA processing protein [Ligilactobacillus salitolerans]